MAGSEHPPGGDGGAGAARGRRPSARVLSAAVAALVVVVGGGYLAAHLGRSGHADTTPLKIAGTAEPPVLAVPAPGPSGSGGGTGTSYVARGALPKGPSSAHVYREGPAVTAGQVAALAHALGVRGTPRVVDGSWQVGAGSGRQLRVARQAPGSWTYLRVPAAPGAGGCTAATPCPMRPDGAAAPSGGVVGPASEATALKAAAPVLEAAGEADAKVDASRLLGGVRLVNADPVVGGLPTYGWETALQIGTDGSVAGGSGLLSAPGRGASYPVIGAADALKALNASGGTAGCAPPGPRTGPVTGAEPAHTASCGPVGPPRRVPVDRAVFGLSAQTVDGGKALVPSWLFTAHPAGAAPYTVARPALPSRYLASVPPRHGMRPAAPAPAAPSTPPGAAASGTRPSATPGRGVAPDVMSYAAQGRDLRVTFWGGVCGSYGLRADESGSAVRVEVEKPKPTGSACVAMAKEFHETVRLDRPLGDRRVVDASGDAVPRS